MKKHLIYELKKNLMTIIIFTAIFCLVYIAALLNADFVYIRYNYDAGYAVADGVYGGNSLIGITAVFLCVLCTIVPVMTYSFKMNRRCVDSYYSLPMRREKLYLVKSIVGLATVLIPYIIAYWLGFLVVVFKENMFNLAAYVPVFFISLPLAVGLFGINAFAFTRANKPIDGVIFIVFFSCAFAAVALYILNMTGNRQIDFSFWFSYSPISYIFAKYAQIIKNTATYYRYFSYDWLLYLFGCLAGIAAWCGLFFTLKKEKAENAEQISDSRFGYKVFIPFYIVFLFSIANEIYYSPIWLVLFAVAGIVLYIIYRRAFKLLWTDWVTAGSAAVLGIILTIISSAITS